MLHPSSSAVEPGAGTPVFVALGTGEGVLVAFGVAVAVGVGVFVGTADAVGVAVFGGGGVGVPVGVAVGAGNCWHTPSTQGRSSGQSAGVSQCPAGWHTSSKHSSVGGQSASIVQDFGVAVGVGVANAIVTWPLLPLAGKCVPEASLTSTLSAVSVTVPGSAISGMWNVQVARSPVPRGTKIVAQVPPTESQSVLLLQA
jgi:hypothetical protein